MHEVTDDSGFMALIDPVNCHTFVAENWDFEQLIFHFKTQMVEQHMLIWGTGCEGVWRVKLEQSATKAKGFREVSGQITVSSGRILLTNYESLTMAAQFPDVTLPEKHQEDLLIDLPPGKYTCRIVQMFDPEDYELEQEDRECDFVIDFVTADDSLPAWDEIPWLSI